MRGLVAVLVALGVGLLEEVEELGDGRRGAELRRRRQGGAVYDDVGPEV